MESASLINKNAKCSNVRAGNYDKFVQLLAQKKAFLASPHEIAGAARPGLRGSTISKDL
jgi:hypothetical protein